MKAVREHPVFVRHKDDPGACSSHFFCCLCGFELTGIIYNGKHWNDGCIDIGLAIERNGRVFGCDGVVHVAPVPTSRE